VYLHDHEDIGSEGDGRGLGTDKEDSGLVCGIEAGITTS